MTKRARPASSRIGLHAVRCLAVGLAAGPSSISHAATSTSFQASATIVSGCEINGSLPTPGQAIGQIGTLNFGVHSALDTGPVTAALAQNAGLTIACTPAVSLMMSIGGGLHSATTRNLQATGSSARLSYRLYRDPGFSQELLINQAVAVTFADPSHVALPIYGRLTLPGNAVPDTFEDTVVVTLTW